MAEGLVFSDLHMFSATSTWQSQLVTLEQRISRARTVVLNGDTIDFKRSTWSSAAETARAGISWLEKILSANPGTRFYYVVGNHDAVKQFLTLAKELSRERPHFSVHHTSLLLGTNLFLHGDACHGALDDEALGQSRLPYQDVEPSASSKALARLIVSLRANLLAYLTHPKKLICGRIIRYLETTAASELQTAERIYFGHTHVPFENYAFAGKLFSNTGGAIQNLEFRPLPFNP